MTFARSLASFIIAAFLISTFAGESITAQRTRRQVSASSGQGLIGLVDNSDFRYRDGCGCSLFPSSCGRNLRHHYYLLTETGNALGKTAWMNVDGTTVQLSLLNTTKPSGRERKGGKFTEVYRGASVTARINYVVTKANVPGGEVTQYAATITMTRGDRNQTVRAVGDCGC